MKPKLAEVPHGYYIAPAVFNHRLPCRVKTAPRASHSLEHEAKKNKKGGYTVNTFHMPTKSVSFYSETYLKSAKPGVKLVNYRDHLKSPFGLINWLDNPDLAQLGNHLLIQDSGGFQIAVGREEFISPAQLLEAHRNVDLGVSMDIPLVGFNGRELSSSELKRLVAVTRRTNRYLEDNSYPTYLNVNHGATIRERLKWLEASKKGVKGGAGLSVGGFRTSSKAYIHPKAFASAASALVKESGYKYFHFLGATAGWQMVILAAIAARNKVVITSDSSTWIQLAISASMLNRNFECTDMPPKGSPLNYRKLDCRCPICKKVDLLYPYSTYTQLLLTHNLLMVDTIAKDIRDIWTANPDTPVSVPLPYVKDSLAGVDDYINGKKTWAHDKPLRAISGKSNANSLFKTHTTTASSDGSGLLAIADKFDAWFKENT